VPQLQSAAQLVGVSLLSQIPLPQPVLGSVVTHFPDVQVNPEQQEVDVVALLNNDKNPSRRVDWHAAPSAAHVPLLVVVLNVEPDFNAVSACVNCWICCCKLLIICCI